MVHPLPDSDDYSKDDTDTEEEIMNFKSKNKSKRGYKSDEDEND